MKKLLSVGPSSPGPSSRTFSNFSGMRFHVSGLTKYCLREAFYSMYIRKRPNRQQLNGSNVHSAIFSILSVADVKIEPRVEVDCGEYSVVGKPDVVTPNSVVEIKTTSTIPEKPYFAHVVQTQFYVHATEKQEGFVFYTTRDLQAVRKFQVEKRYPKTIFKNAEVLYQAVANWELPEPKQSRYCDYCPFRGECGEERLPSNPSSSSLSPR